MIFTNIYVDSNKENPTPMQNMLNIITSVWNSNSLFLNQMTPFHWAMMAMQVNRSMARALTGP